MGCPVKFKDSDGKDFWIQTEVHLIDNKIGILLGLTTCDQYNVYIGTRDNEIVMKDHKEGEKKVIGFRSGNHLALPTQPLDRSRNEKAPEGSPTSWKNSPKGRFHMMYVDMLQNCKQDVTEKLGKIKQKQPIINIENDSDDKFMDANDSEDEFMDDSDSEDEFMDALEEIPNPIPAQIKNTDVTLACNNPINETHEADNRQIPAQVDVKLDCD